MRKLLQLVCCLAIALVMALHLFTQDAPGATIEWPITSGGNGHYYEFVNANLLWPAAKSAAESKTYLGLPGHLVSIASAEENNFVFQNMMTPSEYTIGAWIGMTDNESYGGYESFGQPNPSVDGWVWVTGEPVTFTGWDSPPSNDNNNEDFALMHAYTGTLAWNDQSDYYTANYIVEYEAVPEPSTLALLGMGAFGLLAWAWRRRK